MGKNTYFSSKSVFGQLISLIDDSTLQKEVKKCNSDRYGVSTFDVIVFQNP
jgi:hypothetical protein